MKKACKLFIKTLLALVSAISALFALYITNADGKLVEVAYDLLLKFHNNKKTEDKI